MSRAVVVVGMLAGFGLGYLGLAVGSVATADAKPKPEATDTATKRVDAGQPFDASGWTQLGQAVVTGEKSTATIALRAGKAKFERLALVVDGSGLEVSGITVVTTGGNRIVRKVDHRFTADAASAQIDLGGSHRAVKSIVLAYDLPADATATVTVYGRDRAPAGIGTGATSSARANKTEVAARTVAFVAGAATSDSKVSTRDGWTLLGSRTVDGKNDADVIRAPADAGGLYSQLAIVVTGGDLELKAMKLRFDGGRSADIDTRYYFRADGSRTKLITLPAAGESGTTVRLIQLKYGADRGQGKTRVQVWAR